MTWIHTVFQHYQDKSQPIIIAYIMTPSFWLHRVHSSISDGFSVAGYEQCLLTMDIITGSFQYHDYVCHGGWHLRCFYLTFHNTSQRLLKTCNCCLMLLKSWVKQVCMCIVLTVFTTRLAALLLYARLGVLTLICIKFVASFRSLIASSTRTNSI